MKHKIILQKGFTLIEMLAVMFIIGIIFSITLPAFGPLTSTLKLSTASENLANAIESARQLAMTKGSDIYVLFPISADASMNYRAYKIYNPAGTSPFSVGKWEMLPIGVRINSSSTALRGDDFSIPFPEDTSGTTRAVKYLICSPSGSIVPGGASGSNTITLFYDIDGNGSFSSTSDKNLFQNITVYNIPRKVDIKDIGVVCAD